jgi:hypothetical protein
MSNRIATWISFITVAMVASCAGKATDAHGDDANLTQSPIPSGTAPKPAPSPADAGAAKDNGAKQEATNDPEVGKPCGGPKDIACAKGYICVTEAVSVGEDASHAPGTCDQDPCSPESTSGECPVAETTPG